MEDKWVYAPETALHIIAQEPVYEARLGKDEEEVVCVCVFRKCPLQYILYTFCTIDF